MLCGLSVKVPSLLLREGGGVAQRRGYPKKGVQKKRDYTEKGLNKDALTKRLLNQVM